MLLAERGRPPLAGYWSLPGGVLEVGEKLEEGVRREVLEATGLRVEPGPIFTVFERILRDRRDRVEYHYVLADYVCKIVGGELRAADDVSRVEWVARGDLGKYRITEGTVEVIQEAFRRRKGP